MNPILYERLLEGYRHDLLAGISMLTELYQDHTGQPPEYEEICAWLGRIEAGEEIPCPSDFYVNMVEKTLTFHRFQGLWEWMQSAFPALGVEWFAELTAEGPLQVGEYCSGRQTPKARFYDGMIERLFESNILQRPVLTEARPNDIHHVAFDIPAFSGNPGFIRHIYFQMVPDHGLYALYADVEGNIPPESQWHPVDAKETGLVLPLLAATSGLGDKYSVQGVSSDEARVLNDYPFLLTAQGESAVSREALTQGHAVEDGAPLSLEIAADLFIIDQLGSFSPYQRSKLLEMAPGRYRLTLGSDGDVWLQENPDDMAVFLASQFGFHAEAIWDHGHCYTEVLASPDELNRSAQLVTLYVSLRDTLLQACLANAHEQLLPPAEGPSDDDVKAHARQFMERLNALPDDAEKTPLQIAFQPSIMHARILFSPIGEKMLLAYLTTGHADLRGMAMWEAYANTHAEEAERWHEIVEKAREDYRAIALRFRLSGQDGLGVDLQAGPPIDDMRQHELRTELGQFLHLIGWLSEGLTISPYTGTVSRLDEPIMLKPHIMSLPEARYLAEQAEADMPEPRQPEPEATAAMIDMPLLRHISDALKDNPTRDILDIVREYEHMPHPGPEGLN